MCILFSGSDSTENIVNEALHNGIVGIHGGRLEVRKKMKEVRKELEQLESNNIIALSTYDHPATELGIIYDDNIYNSVDAKNEIISSYDNLY